MWQIKKLSYLSTMLYAKVRLKSIATWNLKETVAMGIKTPTSFFGSWMFKDLFKRMRHIA